jgi:5-methylcytosine-specific restriction endonuclease McrA
VSIGGEPKSTKAAFGQIGFDFDALADGPGAAPHEDLERETARFHIDRMRELLREAGEATHDMRAPCLQCGCSVGILKRRGNQNAVRCAQCGRHAYNAPKTETGAAVRSARTMRSDMKPAQQARILDRDNGRCLLCGRPEDLVIGHLLSVADGVRLGATASELNHDANLAVMCEACNAGLGKRSVSTRTFLVLSLRILQAEIRRNGPLV